MKRGIKTIIAGVAVCLAAAIIVPLLIVFLVVSGFPHESQFKIPGTLEVDVKNPGRYYVWNDYRTIFNGKSYDRSEKIPDGIEIQVHDANGRQLQFITDTSISSSDGGSAKDSIGYVEVDRPGKLDVAVSGGSEERIFSFSRFELLKAVGLVLGSVGFAMLAGIAGIALVIWGIVKLVSGKGVQRVVAGSHS